MKQSNIFKLITVIILTLIVTFFLNKYLYIFKHMEGVFYTNEYTISVYVSDVVRNGNTYRLQYSYHNANNEFINESILGYNNQDIFFKGTIEKLEFSITGILGNDMFEIKIFKNGKLTYQKSFNHLGSIIYEN